MNLTIEHCYRYVRSLHHKDVCGIRGDPRQTLMSRVAKFATGQTIGYAYLGGDILVTPDGYQRLPPQIARLTQAFEDCRVNDFGAYDVDENGLTAGVYRRLPCGAWFDDYWRRDCLKAYSPDSYRNYYQKPRRNLLPTPERPS